MSRPLLRVPSLALGAFLAVTFLLAGDGLDSWQWRNPLPQGNGLLGVTGGDDIFVAVGDTGTILTSSNALDWTPITRFTTGRFYGVAHHAGLFVAVGPGIWTSSNGLNWTQRDTSYLYAVAWADGVFVAAGWQGTILTSTNGLDWVSRASGVTEQLKAIAHGNGSFVVAGGYFTNSALLTSADAVLWTNRTTGTDIPNGVAYGNGLFVAVGFNFYGNTGVSLTSSDGVNWSRHVLGPAIYAADGVCFDQGVFVLASTHGLFTSTDGVNWINRYAESPNSFFAVTAHNGTFVAVGGAGAIVTSQDGTLWTRRTVGTWHSIYAIARGNNTLVAAGDRGATMRSVNGADWTYHSLGVDTGFIGMTFGLGRFVAVGSIYNGFNSVPKIFSSSDGVSWSNQPAPGTSYLYDVTFADGTFVAVGGVGVQGEILVSTNAQTWTPCVTGIDHALRGVGFGNGTFIAVGDSGAIVTSTNGGNTWMTQNSGTTEVLSGVAYGNGLFVTGDSYGHILTSSNGSSWSSQSFNPYNTIIGVAYGHGMFVTVGNGSILTSSNGLNWTSRSLPTSDRLNAVLYTGDSFVTVGEWGIILESGHFGPPRMSGARQGVDGFGFTIAGEHGRRYRIQTSTNLSNPAAWTDWLDYTNGVNAAPFLDLPSGWPRKFYRVVTP